MKKVLMLSGCDCSYPFLQLGYKVTSKYAPEVNKESLDEYDAIIFSGGQDINPKYYNHKDCIGYRDSKSLRDLHEKRVYELSKEIGIPMIGICRGLQFINVMEGGWLIQHVDNHAGTNHDIKIINSISKFKNGKKFRVNSCHHQMCVLPSTAIPLSESEPIISEVIYDRSVIGDIGKITEIESAYFPEAKAIGVQYHPEWMDKNSTGVSYFNELVSEVLK